MNLFVKDTYLAERYGVSRRTIWRWTNMREFPSPHKLSPRCTRWKMEEVEQWEASRLSYN